MLLLDLPEELLQAILCFVDADSDMNVLTCTCRHVSTLANLRLYKRDSCREVSRALIWALEHDQLETAQRSLHGGVPASVAPLLNVAAKHDSVRVLEFLLNAKGADLNADCRTLLLEATANGASKVVKHLLTRDDADPNATDNKGKTALTYAAKANRPDLVHMILAHPRVNVNFADGDGNTPLIEAAASGYADVVEALLSADLIGVDLANMRNQTAISQAAMRLSWTWSNKEWNHEPNCRKAFVLLLNHPATSSINLDHRDSYGSRWIQSVYWDSAISGHEDVFRLLFTKGRQQNIVVNSDTDKSILSSVAEKGKLGIMKVMLAADCTSPDGRDREGRTPLSYAAATAQVEAMRMLLDTGNVDVNSEDKNGRTPLWWLLKTGPKEADEAINLLLAHNDSVPIIDDGNLLQESLRKAFGGNSPRLCKLLMDQRKYASLSREKRRFLLSTALATGSKSVVQLLLQKGNLDLNADKFSQTVIVLAAFYHRDDVLDLLLSHDEIDHNVKGKNGLTGLEVALKRLDQCLSDTKWCKKEAWSTRHHLYSSGRDMCVNELIARRVAFVEILLASPVIATESLPYDSLTRLLFTYATSGEHQILKLFITKDSRLHSKSTISEKEAETLVAWAQQRGYEAMAQQLSEKGMLAANSPTSRA